MISLVIKYCFIIFCSLYTTICLTNKRQVVSTFRGVIRISFILVQIPLVISVRHYAISMGILVMVLSSMFLDRVFLTVNINTAILVAVISYSISYTLYAGGILVLMAIKSAIGDHSNTVSPLAHILIGIVQILFSMVIFRTKRLCHGLSFLQDSHRSVLGASLSISLLMMSAVLGIKMGSYQTTILLFYFILGLGVLLWIWYKNYLGKEYLDQVKKREQNDLETSLAIANEKIKKLRCENETFSKIIYQDNKLIPAMELAVSQLLYLVVQDDNRNSRMEQTKKILEQLKSLSKERAGIVKNYEYSNQTASFLGLDGLDAMLHFMVQKATTAGVSFEVHVSEGAGKALLRYTTEQDASTLLADLMENALIAATWSKQERAVGVEVVVDEEGIFCIHVRDSGAPFPQEVLERWGVERITTHKDTGGSGIGMMTIYELCQKYNASFEIQYLHHQLPYRKCVSIRYNGLGAFLVP